MPHRLEAFLAQQRHRHLFQPLPARAGDVELERCTCGAMRQAQQPETD